jgi:3-oxoacyl-[acyl-carrier-protein] synthase-1
MSALAITGIGAVTPVGLSAPASAAAFRAGIARLGPIMSSEVDGPAGGTLPAVAGRVPLEWFDGGPKVEEWPGHERFEHPFPPPEHLVIEDGIERLLRLAVPAAAESWRHRTPGRAPLRNWGLFIGISAEEPPDAGKRLANAVTTAVEHIAPTIVDTVAEGRAAGLAALHRAAAAIASGKISGALVGGIDSLLRPSVHQRLLKAGVIKDRSSNPHGILPGEAAAFMLIETDATATPSVKLYSTAVAEEPTAGSDEPNRGAGLTNAIRTARGAAPLPYVPLMICDLNGDRYRALEWGMVFPRSLGDLPWRYDLPNCGQFWHPADCIGDTGAASGILNCVWTVEALRKGYAGVDRVLVWGASEGRLRAAAVFGPAK